MLLNFIEGVGSDAINVVWASLTSTTSVCHQSVQVATPRENRSLVYTKKCKFDDGNQSVFQSELTLCIDGNKRSQSKEEIHRKKRTGKKDGNGAASDPRP